MTEIRARTFDALLDFLAVVAQCIFQLQFEVRKNAQQRIIDFVRGAEGELRERGVLFVLREFAWNWLFSLLSSPLRKSGERVPAWPSRVRVPVGGTRQWFVPAAAATLFSLAPEAARKRP